MKQHSLLLGSAVLIAVACQIPLHPAPTSCISLAPSLARSTSFITLSSSLTPPACSLSLQFVTSWFHYHQPHPTASFTPITILPSSSPTPPTCSLGLQRLICSSNGFTPWVQAESAAGRQQVGWLVCFVGSLVRRLLSALPETAFCATRAGPLGEGGGGSTHTPAHTASHTDRVESTASHSHS